MLMLVSSSVKASPLFETLTIEIGVVPSPDLVVFKSYCFKLAVNWRYRKGTANLKTESDSPKKIDY